MLPSSAALSKGSIRYVHSPHLKIEAQTLCFHHKSLTETDEQNQSAVIYIMSFMISTPHTDISKTLSGSTKWIVHTIYMRQMRR